MNTVRFFGFVSIVVAAIPLSGLVSPSAAQASECYEKAPLRPIHRTWVRRDIVEPGLYDVTRAPSHYGYYKRRVVREHNAGWHETRPVYRTVTKRVRVGGGWTWANKCVAGKELRCKVRNPVRYELRQKQVLVHGAKRRVYTDVGYVHERVLIRPYRNIASFHPPHVRTYRERVKIYPEGHRWVPTHSRPDC